MLARYTQKTLSHFLLNTRGLSRLQILLSPPQKGRRKRRDFYGKKCCRDVLRSSPCVILSGARRSARSRTDLATNFSCRGGAAFACECSLHNSLFISGLRSKRSGFIIHYSLFIWGRGPIWTLLSVYSEQNRQKFNLKIFPKVFGDS